MTSATTQDQNQGKTYIQQQIQAGVTPVEIQQQLQAAGWQDADIQAAFALVQADISPVAPAAAQDIPDKPARGRFKTGWLLFKQSLRIMQHNPVLYRYTVVSSVWLTLVCGVLLYVVYQWHDLLFIAGESSAYSSRDSSMNPLGYALAFVFYILAFSIINFYGAALALHLMDIFAGKDAGYKVYIGKARKRFKVLFIYACIEATVGIALRAVADKGGAVGRVAGVLGGMAWSIARLFAVPIIATTDVDAMGAIKQSTQLVIKTWGENLAGRVALSGALYVVYIAVVLPVCIVLALTLFGTLGLVGLFIALGVFVIIGIGVSVLSSTADSILNVVLYYYATNRQVPAAFDASLINTAFVAKKAKKAQGA